jgi:hypothetical protein
MFSALMTGLNSLMPLPLFLRSRQEQQYPLKEQQSLSAEEKWRRNRIMEIVEREEREKNIRDL